MRVTRRDVRLLRDLALSHVLSRDQTIALKYFGSVTRANTRLRGLRSLGLVRTLDTPYFNQSLYAVRAKASEIVGERLAPLTRARRAAPRFIQHALAVTDVRVCMMAKGADQWLFEQQASVRFTFGGRGLEVRPDGVAVEAGVPVPVEVDLGHVVAAKFREKLKAYDAFVRSGESLRSWRATTFTLLVVTTGRTRAARLSRLHPNPAFTLAVRTFEELGIRVPGAWS